MRLLQGSTVQEPRRQFETRPCHWFLLLQPMMGPWGPNDQVRFELHPRIHWRNQFSKGLQPVSLADDRMNPELFLIYGPPEPAPNGHSVFSAVLQGPFAYLYRSILAVPKHKGCTGGDHRAWNRTWMQSASNWKVEHF